MGQAAAAIDLPDPVEAMSNAAAAPLGSADDLLSQLAGQEIDRLLSEADGGPEALDADIAREADAEFESDEQHLQELLDPAKVDAELQSTTGAAGSSGSSSISSTEDTYANQVDELFKNLNVDLPKESPASEVRSPGETETAATTSSSDVPAAAPPAVAKLASEQPHADALAFSPEPVESEFSTTAAERAALHAPVAETEPTLKAQPHSELAAAALPRLEKVLEEVPRQRMAWLVRLLELLNAPFSACPDVLRDLLGKVAILTIMNSVGVLLYVLLFRK